MACVGNHQGGEGEFTEFSEFTTATKEKKKKEGREKRTLSPHTRQLRPHAFHTRLKIF